MKGEHSGTFVTVLNSITIYCTRTNNHKTFNVFLTKNTTNLTIKFTFIQVLVLFSLDIEYMQNILPIPEML